MKKLFTLITAVTLLLFSEQTNAAGGPDAYGYTWITSLDPGGPTYSWIDISSRPGVQTVTGLADDNSAPGMINIGFNFHYYWSDYSTLKVGSNGWTSFNPVSNIASCFPTIPTPGGAGDNLLAALMGDLNFTGAGNIGQVKYWTNSVDSFIISYINVPFWSVNAPGWVGSNSFQIILCNSDSSITYQYGSLSGFTPAAGCIDMTVGIENSTGAIGLQVHSDVMPPNNYVIRFDYPSVVLLSIQDPLPLWNDNAANAANFILRNYAFTPVMDVKNAGNTAVTTTINLQADIFDATPTNVYTATATVPSLAAGDDTAYAFIPAWTPTVAGQYTFQSNISNSQDINTTNNAIATELDVVDPCISTMALSYNTGGASSGSINWNGGANDDGVAVHFVPPIYPYNVTSLQYYIASNVSHGYIAQIYADDGPNNTAGTQLFTTTVASGSVVASSWNTVNVTSTVTINSGGFYVVWLQGGTTIFLGTETAGARSHRNYEILDNSWATFRYDDSQDAMIRCTIGNYAGTPTAAATLSTNALNLNCTDGTTGMVTSWLWDFGDATTSTQQNPTHTYSTAGTYTVCLTSTSSCGSSQACSTITVCATPTAQYASATNALNATFTDQSTGTVSTYLWDFGDGNFSTVQNPTHTYSSAGTYTVCLIISNVCGDADTICQTISLCNANASAFTSTSTGLNTGFVDQSTGAIDTYDWDFGDGNFSTAQNPSHTYATPGIYTVCLIVANTCGFADTTCQTVTVCELNVAAFTDSTNEDSLTVTNTSSGAIVSWLWDYGDGNYDSIQNPATHNYATGGVYTVCLTTTDSCGIVDSVCHTVVIMITDINGIASGHVAVYPNPAHDELFVALTEPAIIEIYDMTGKLVIAEGNATSSLFPVNISSLADGMYTIRVITESGFSIARFTKQ